MARPLRLEYPGAVYHVTVRGNARQAIFLDDEDRASFLNTLGSVVARYHWLCHAYCLMDNHYHLLTETPDANLSQGMRQLNSVYTQGFNRRHGRVGHVLQGRFNSILVDKDSYLLELARYVVLNPVRANIAGHPADWAWSSYRATSGEAPVPEFLTTDWLLAQFGSVRHKAQEGYREFVAEGADPSVWDRVHGGVILGGEAFVKSMTDRLKDKRQLEEVPRAQRFATRPSLAKLFAGIKDKARRNERICEAYLEHGYSLSQIGAHLGLHYSMISKVVRKERGGCDESHGSRSDP